MSEMRKISIIVPNYNYGRFLKERIRSVLKQTWTDFELLYVDDGSSDESNRIAQPFEGDPRVRLRLCKHNSGTVYQRWNEAAKQASGEWLWFANADDSSHPRFLERLLSLVEGHPNVAIAHSDIAYIDEDGRLMSCRTHGTAETMAHLTADRVTSGIDELVFLTRGLYLRTASAVILRRDAFLEAGGFDTRLWGVADYDLYLKILHWSDIAYAAEPLTYYRKHTSNTTDSAGNILGLALAYAFACTFERMKGDRRFTQEMQAAVLRSARVQVFELFANASVIIPAHWRFAAVAVHEVVRDRRLLSRCSSGLRESIPVSNQR
jgi:glycosyltransferase involved in cell wall biosynthesis